jgi:hypothetical protein
MEFTYLGGRPCFITDWMSLSQPVVEGVYINECSDE